MRGPFIARVIVLPDDEGLLYWVDPDAADGLELYLLRGPGEAPRPLGTTLLASGSVAIGPPGSFSIVTGHNRYAWMDKTLEDCAVATARCLPVPAAKGVLTLGPAWSPNGTLAFVKAPASSATNFYQATVTSWYAEHALWTMAPGQTRGTEVAGAGGATSPEWSANGKSLLFVSGDALWLLPSLGATPQKVAGPLFPANAWPTYYGEVGWQGQFAWSSLAPS
jgi:hypothetical protein